jgi:hypothetical protein
LVRVASAKMITEKNAYRIRLMKFLISLLRESKS